MMTTGNGAVASSVAPTGGVLRMDHLPQDHLIHQMNLRVVDPVGAAAAIEIDLEPKVLNGHDALQGGVLATMVDVVGGQAVHATLSEPSTFVTRDLSVHYLRRLSLGPVRAVATVRQRSRRNVVMQVDVVDREGNLGAIATLTFAVAPSEQGASNEATATS